MTTRKFTLTTNLTILILGGAGMATWMAACDGVDDGADVRIAALSRAPESSLETVNQIPADYVLTPGGVLFHKSCVHEIPDGAQVHPDHSVHVKGKQIAQYAECAHKRYRFANADEGIAPGTGNGWVEASWGSSTQAMFTHMDAGSWQVPPNPANLGQLLYFFPSLTQGSGPAIIQPVLQWGWNGNFGGAYWLYANWWVDGTTLRFVSSTKSAVAGDQMNGTLNFDNQNGNLQSWTIVARNTTKGTSTTSSFTVDNGAPFNQVQAGVLEAYSVSNCSAFPSGSTGWTYFSAPVLYQGTYFNDRNLINPSWSFLGSTVFSWTGPNCGFGGTVGSNGETTLNY